MKLVSLLPIAGLVSLGLVSAADVSITTGSGDTLKTYAKLTEADGGITFCPTAACDTVNTKITPAKIAEWGASAAVADQAVTTFKATNTDVVTAKNTWVAGDDVKGSDGTTVIAKTWTYMTALKTPATTPVDLGSLELTVAYYTAAGSGTVNAKTITYPAGSVVISAKVPKWAWKDDSTENTLKFDWSIASTESTATTLASAVTAADGTWLATIGGGVTLKAPEKALKGTSTVIAATPTVSGSAKPYTLTLAIDNFGTDALTYTGAVLAYTAPETTAPETTAPSATTPAPSGASSLWGYAASVVVGGAAIAAMMF